MTKNNSTTKILVCVHKKDFYLSDGTYMPIQVGKSISDLDLGITGDNTGDNISTKNKEFCELTAQYWAWKNLKNADYIGLAHYRRYLSLQPKHQSLLFDCVTPEKIETPAFDPKEYFPEYDIILSNQDYHYFSNKIYYCYNHVLEDFIIFRNVINRIYPEYTESFDYVMDQNNRTSVGNLFISRWDRFDHYSNWLFGIMFEAEKEIKPSPYEYQRRVFGFMAERLIDVYCHFNKLNIKRFPILYVTDTKEETVKMYNRRKIKANLSFKLTSKTMI
ncbi:MAG: DUF4422 domain-containing protein [Dysgonomonas sp.]